MWRVSVFSVVFAFFLLAPFALAQQPLPPPVTSRDARGVPANQQRYLPDLTAGDPDGNYTGDHFGSAVDTSGDWMVVGSPDDDNAGAADSRRGSVYFLKRDSTTGTWAKLMEATGAVDQMYFGAAVSIRDNGTLGLTAVGAPGLTVNGESAAGRVYVFSRTGDSWIIEDVLEAPVAEENARFGESVSISGSKIVVGAGGDRFGGTDMGAAYVFRRETSPAIAWVFEQKITPADGASGNLFGASVAINELHGNRVLVGAPGNDVGGVDSGAAYLYEFDTGASQWIADGPRIDSPFGAAGDRFGASVALSYSEFIDSAAYFAIGMPGHDSNTGAAASYYRTFDDDQIPAPSIIESFDGTAGDLFGASVDIRPFAFEVIVGAEEDSTAALTDAGSVYSYSFAGIGGEAILQGKYVASLAESGDKFGTSVAFDDEGGFVVGTPLDSHVLGSEGGSIYQIRPAAVYGLSFGGTISENGDMGFMSVSLATRPTSVVTLVLTPGSQCAVTLSGPPVPGEPLNLFFDTTPGGPSGWDTLRSVQVHALDDADNEGTHGCTVFSAVSSSDAAYGSLPPMSAVFTIEDNDADELLTNTSFESPTRAGLLAPWVLTNKTKDKVKCGLDVPTAHGACAFLFKGGPGESSKLTYRVDPYPLERSYGDVVAVSMQLLRQTPDARLVVKVKVKYADGSDQVASATIVPWVTPNYIVYELPPLSLGDPFAEPAPVITVVMTHKSLSGKLYLDDVHLLMSRNGFVFNRAEAAPLPPAPAGFRR